ncbi:MAG: hypothetical protein KY461_11565, partial [Actinobacteria bacterium]|nr:hypothetical protein [Actinomycetota bacterium]
TPTPVEPEQATLPFDAALDDPIPFALTARARRAIAPDSLPQLTLLDDPSSAPAADVAAEEPAALAFEDAVDADPEDPADTRPARARALRHAGIDVDQIAEELAVDELVVRAWVDDITPVRSATRRLRSVPAGPTPAPAQRARVEARRRRAEEAYEATRTGARRAAADRIAADPTFVSGLGLVTGVAEVSPQGIVLTTRDLDVARAAVRWLTGTVEVDPTRVRVLLRLAPQVAADVTVHAWQGATGLPKERFTTARWRQAPTADAVEAMVRIADPRVAGALAGWRDALLGSFADGADSGLEHAW